MATQEFDFGELDELYREVILDYYRYPRNRQVVKAPDFESTGFNPFCGDEVVIQIKLDGGGQVVGVGHQGQGCSISQASASMLTELAKGKGLEALERLSHTFRQLMQGGELTDEEMESLGNLEALQGVRKFPIRIKCALLAWAALEEGIEGHRARSKGT